MTAGLRFEWCIKRRSDPGVNIALATIFCMQQANSSGNQRSKDEAEKSPHVACKEN
jgi:hypothetical protein